jgi:hypothetical protein
MKTYGGVKVWLHALTLALGTLSGQLHALVALSHMERVFDTHYIGGCMGPRVCLATVEQDLLSLPKSQPRHLCHTAHNLLTILSELFKLPQIITEPIKILKCNFG